MIKDQKQQVKLKLKLIKIMKKLLIITLLFLFSGFTGFGQRRIINLPDLPGYVTLKVDFHMHTIFSDGNVWPTFRVDEAVRDGLDAIAISDHLEYNPKKDYIPIDQNAAWKICETYARERNLILVHAAEITRSMPPGHINALFIKDANLINKDSVWDAFEAAIKQGAFLQWNHPGWKAQEPDGIPKMYDIHKKLLKNGWLKGIEFYNESENYPLVLDWCKQFNLTVMGNSDVHGIISEIYSKPLYNSRPMTLIFAKERTFESLKEALFAGRTLVWFKDIIGGKEEFAKPFFYRCITVSKPYFQNNKSLFLEIINKSDIPYYLVNGPKDAPPSITLEANSITRVIVGKTVSFPLVYDVKNIMTGGNTVLKVDLKY
jgi:3',5'-nucleoside bisphosphate phosphatase